MGTGRKYILITCETRLEQRGRFLHDPFMHSMYEDVAVAGAGGEITDPSRPRLAWRSRVAEKNGENGCIPFVLNLKIVSSSVKPCDCVSPAVLAAVLVYELNCQIRGGRRSYPFCEYLARIGPLLRGSCEDSTTPAPGSGHAIAASLYVPWSTQHAIPFSSMLRCGSVTCGHNQAMRFRHNQAMRFRHNQAMRFRHLGHNQARSGPDARLDPRQAPTRRCSDGACRWRQRRVPQIMVMGCEARLPRASNGP